MCLLGLAWRHFWDLDCHSFLFTYCWEVLSPSWLIMLCKCSCTEAVKNNLILESISSSTAWWKVHICWSEPGRAAVWQTFSSGNSKRFCSLPWEVVQWLLNGWWRESTQHRANNHCPGSSFHLSFPLIFTLLFHFINKTSGLLLMKQLPTTETGMTSKQKSLGKLLGKRCLEKNGPRRKGNLENRNWVCLKEIYQKQQIKG